MLCRSLRSAQFGDRNPAGHSDCPHVLHSVLEKLGPGPLFKKNYPLSRSTFRSPSGQHSHESPVRWRLGKAALPRNSTGSGGAAPGMAECIDYGVHTPDESVLHLTVDANVASRGHRSNIFSNDGSPRFMGAGVARGAVGSGLEPVIVILYHPGNAMANCQEKCPDYPTGNIIADMAASGYWPADRPLAASSTLFRFFRGENSAIFC